MDNRGAATVVAKLLAFGIVLLYVGGMTTVLYGGAVPDYRDAAGAELGDRVLVTAADRIEGTIQPEGRVVEATRTVDLPASIRGAAYELRVDGLSLALEHPSPSIGGQVRLALPAHVDAVEGRWQSGAETVVAVESDGDDIVVRLVEGQT